uniref:C-type lectin domain-containing protein n=1 Tax=Panagrolaimus sp. ES5 TaxID=591445 RepID=A0AC34GBB1_9BILA
MPGVSNSCYGGQFTGTWSEAEENCKEQGAHLVSIHSRDEQDLIATMVGLVDDWFWIGLYSIDDSHNWIYSDGTPYDYMNWHKGYPGNGNYECVNIDRDGTWLNDASCNRNGYAFCRKDILLH